MASLKKQFKRCHNFFKTRLFLAIFELFRRLFYSILGVKVRVFRITGFWCVFYCTKISSEPCQDVELRYNTFRPAAVIEIFFCLLLYREGREKLFLGENIFAVYRRFLISIIPHSMY